MSPSRKRGCRYWFNLLAVGLLGGVLIACVAIEVFYIYFMVRPATGSICCTTPADLGLEYEDVTLTSADGTRLSGWYLPSSNRAAVILLHGYGNNRTELIHHAEILAHHGYGALLYDLRAHGQSQGERRTMGWLDVPDVAAALDFLHNRPEVDLERIGVFGFSVGGQIAIRAAAETNDLRAIIADDPGFVTVADAPSPANASEKLTYLVNWLDVKGMQLATGASQPPGVAQVIGDISPRPLLLISTGTGLGSRLAKHYYQLAGEPKTLWEIPETYHGGGLIARPGEYETQMVTFFDQFLLASGPNP